ncbi:MAG: hypothetical protein CMJ23_09545 [Phycisphaerae bacterium]|nr:hypothetical protein [Phycisphaerae bacterium]
MTSDGIMTASVVFAGLVAAGILLGRKPILAGAPSKDGVAGLPPAFVRLIRRAGYRPDREGWAFMLAVVLAGFSGGGGGFLVASVLGQASDMTIIGLFLGVVMGVFLPLSWLRGRAEDRIQTLNIDFAMMLDLLQLSLMGGQGLSAGWSKVTDAIRDGMPQLAAEMRAVNLEISVGRGWSEALEATSRRSGCEDFSFLGRLLEQSERFGTDLSQAVGAHADSIRHEEFQAIEERAHRDSVRMLFPMILLLLPATLLLMLGPMTLILLEALDSVTPD